MSSPFFFAFFKNVARSPSSVIQSLTFAKFHDYNQSMLKVKRLNVLDDERVQVIIAKFLEDLDLS